MNFTCFLNFPGRQQHLNNTNGKLVYCFRGESSFFGQNYPNEGFQTLYFPAIYILHPYKQPAEDISKRAPKQAGRALFS